MEGAVAEEEEEEEEDRDKVKVVTSFPLLSSLPSPFFSFLELHKPNRPRLVLCREKEDLLLRKGR